ncbi:MAG: phage portal protein [Chloroflexi bacterium]|nr:phage portal protein [Chloroflexota bacterium]
MASAIARCGGCAASTRYPWTRSRAAIASRAAPSSASCSTAPPREDVAGPRETRTALAARAGRTTPIGRRSNDDTGSSRAGRRNAVPAHPRAARSRAAGALREFLDYYEGRRGAAPGGPRERSLSFNYARAFVEKGASYLMTSHRPTVVEADGGGAAEAEQALLELWEANDLERLDLESEFDTATLGDGAFKVSWDEQEQRVVVTAPDVQGLYVWWLGDDVRRIRRVAARYETPAEDAEARTGRLPRGPGGRTPERVTLTEVWTAERFELWVEDEPVEARANPYGVIPFVIFPNTPRPKQFWGISDIEPLRESIVELNRAMTQLSRILELSGNPIAVLENVEESRGIAVQPGAVWELPEEARAYLLDLLQGGGVRLHADYLGQVYRTMHDLAEMPRIAFGDGSGDRSGVALRLELDPLLRKVARKRLIRSAAMRRRDRLMLRVLAHHTGRRFEGVRTEIAWSGIFSGDETGLLEAAA